MKKLLPLVFLTALLAACSSSPTKEQEGAAVEERSPTTAAQTPADKGSAKPSGTETKPIEGKPLTGTTLDPAAAAAAQRSIYFDFDAFVIKDEYKPVVEAIARRMKDNPKARVILQGHTDERGTPEYNLALGQKRAEAVKKALGLLGTQDGRMEAVSFGEEKPKAAGHDETAWSENRRVDVVFQ